LNMVAYEFYSRDENYGDNLIGILPERRKDPRRITDESVINWVRKLLGREVDVGNIVFVRIEF
jgi:hypothetical protein